MPLLQEALLRHGHDLVQFEFDALRRRVIAEADETAAQTDGDESGIELEAGPEQAWSYQRASRPR